MHDAILTKAIALHKSGRHHEALPEYERFLAAHPHSVQAIYLRAHCLHSISYHGEIIRPDRLTVVVEDYSKVLAIEPRHMAALSNRGVALIHLGSLDLAIADFEAAIALAPNNSAAHCNLGIALQQQGRIEEAEACFNRVLAIDPEHRHAKLWLGNGAQLSGDYRRGLPTPPLEP